MHVTMEYWMVNTWLEKGETYLTSWHLPRHMQIYRCPWDGKNVPHLHFLTSFTVQCPSVPCLSGIYAQLEIRGALYDFCNMYCNTIGNCICDLDIPTLFFHIKELISCHMWNQTQMKYLLDSHGRKLLLIQKYTS